MVHTGMASVMIHKSGSCCEFFTAYFTGDGTVSLTESSVKF